MKQAVKPTVPNSFSIVSCFPESGNPPPTMSVAHPGLLSSRIGRMVGLPTGLPSCFGLSKRKNRTGRTLNAHAGAVSLSIAVHGNVKTCSFTMPCVSTVLESRAGTGAVICPVRGLICNPFLGVASPALRLPSLVIAAVSLCRRSLWAFPLGNLFQVFPFILECP